MLNVTARVRERWNRLRPMTPIEIEMDPCPGSLAGSVAASASFPPLVGPLTLKIGDEETYWHAGDGGLYENQGLESLLLLYLKQLQLKRAKRIPSSCSTARFPSRSVSGASFVVRSHSPS